MPFCTQCGVTVEERQKFCSACGAANGSAQGAQQEAVEITIRQTSLVANHEINSATAQNSLGAISGSVTYSGMSFGQAIRSVFSKYAVFRGRATRSEYWFFALFNFLIYMGILIIGSVTSGTSTSSSGPTVIFGFLTFIWICVVLLPSISVSVRRLHDAGYSGWLYLLGLIPYLGSIILFIFGLLSSQDSDNRWGHAPQPAAYQTSLR